MYQLLDENDNIININQIVELRDIRGLCNDETEEELNIGDRFLLVAPFQDGEENQAELKSLKTNEIHIFDVSRCVLVNRPNITKSEFCDLVAYHERIKQNLAYLGGYKLTENVDDLEAHIFRRKLLEIEIDLKRTLENVQKARSLAKNL